MGMVVVQGNSLSQENKLPIQFSRDLYEDTVFSGDKVVIWSVHSKWKRLTCQKILISQNFMLGNLHHFLILFHKNILPYVSV